MGSVLVQGLGSRAVSQGGWADVLGAMLQVLQALASWLSQGQSADVGGGPCWRSCAVCADISRGGVRAGSASLLLDPGVLVAALGRLDGCRVHGCSQLSHTHLRSSLQWRDAQPPGSACSLACAG